MDPSNAPECFNDGLNYTFDKVKGNKMAHMAMVKPYLPRPGELRLEPFTGELDLLGDEDGITIIYPLDGDESIIQADDTPYADDMIDGSQINENYIGPDNNPVIIAEAEAPSVEQAPSISDRARSLWDQVRGRRNKKKTVPPPETVEAQETLDNRSSQHTPETATQHSPPRERRHGLRARHKLTKKENGVFVKLTPRNRREIYNESGDDTEPEDSEDERLTTTLRDIVAKKDTGQIETSTEYHQTPIQSLKRSRLQRNRNTLKRHSSFQTSTLREQRHKILGRGRGILTIQRR